MTDSLIHRLIRPFMAVLVGAITPLAFAPYQYWPIAILTPFILLLLIHEQSIKSALLLGYLWGVGLFSTGISWVHVSIDTFGGMPKIASIFLMMLLIGYLAIYPALFAAALNLFFPQSTNTRFLLAAPVLWLLTDWLRGWVMTGFPWLWLGYSQIDSPLASFAPIGGVELITLAVVLCSSAFALVLVNQAWGFILVPVAVFSLGFASANFDWVTPNPSRTVNVALIQGNIDQADKWLPSERWPTLTKYTEMTQANWDADIIIWPEAAIPAFEYEIKSYLTELDRAAQKSHSSIITGVLTQNEDNTYFNSILTLGNTLNGDYRYEPELRYHKRHLLPFGEFVPFEDILRPLAPFFNLPMSSFTPGNAEQPNIMANGYYLAPSLCYEIIFNELVRKSIRNETDFLLTLSNDTWFGRSIGPLQHMEIARMRALELGKPLIRSTNSGVTAITDHKGKIVAQIPQFESNVLTAQVIATEGRTPYYLLGSFPLYILVLINLIIGWLYRP